MRKRHLIIVVLICLVNPFLGAQERVKIKKKEFRREAVAGFREAWRSIGEGNKCYDQGLGTFDLARDHYLLAYRYNSDHPGLNYKIGACYLFTDSKYEAIDYLEHAYRLSPEVADDIHLLLGRAFQLVLEFDSAIHHYQAHLNGLKRDEKEANTSLIERRIAECVSGASLTQDPVRVIIKNLGGEVNSRFDDYNPVFAYNDTALFITSRRPVKKAKRNPLDNKFNEDIYRMSFDGNRFDSAVRLNKPFNTRHNDALVDISPDGQMALLYKGHIDGGELQFSAFKAEKNKWTRSKRFSRRVKSKEGEGSACLSPDGKQIFFVSKHRKYSRGGKDILVCSLNEKGKWSSPRNLGAEINSVFDEEGVFLSEDGKTMYFASRGHNSIGGFDIFKSELDDQGNWSLAENLGYPINTPDDELFYITDKKGQYGYYAANREGGFGARDVYRVIYLGAEKEMQLLMRDSLVAGHGGRKTGYLMLPRLLELDTSMLVQGRVLDTIEGKPVVAKLAFINPETGQVESTVISNASGAFKARLSHPGVFGVEISATGYLYYLDILDLIGMSTDERVEKDFYLQPFDVGTKVVLENIYFQIGKAVLRPESFEALDQVAKFMENNPGMKLEISGHTDNTGSLRTNQRLSRERAKAVVDYLIGKGIPSSVLVYEGYADSQPVAPNNTADGREKNRRVEFKVLSK